MLRSPRPPALRGLARLERRFDGPRRGSRCPGGRSRRLAAGRAGTPPARPMTSVSSVRQVSEPRRFVLDLDGVPAVAPVRGSDFPFTVTASDPEQFRTTLELGEPVDVDWVMELDWICAACTGTVRIPETGHYTHFPLPEKYPPPCSACRPARTHRVDRELHDTQPPDHDVDVRRESRRVHRCRDLMLCDAATRALDLHASRRTRTGFCRDRRSLQNRQRVRRSRESPTPQPVRTAHRGRSHPDLLAPQRRSSSRTPQSRTDARRPRGATGPRVSTERRHERTGTARNAGLGHPPGRNGVPAVTPGRTRPACSHGHERTLVPSRPA
ncbi:hypothetical protein A4R44_06361 [Amycolatopsis sp. M39]|nr:hypothetical protein A4R44_06361 [Amycolatopsis sp. M39]